MLRLTRTARTACTLLLAGLAASGPALSQDGDDWDFGQDPERGLTIAAVSFENFGVAVRCMNDSLSVVMTGLPTASGVRRLRYGVGQEPGAESRWVSGRDSNAAFAVWPRRVATDMSRGGSLVVLAPGADGVQRYAVDLPASREAVGRVFQACGLTLDPANEDSGPSGEQFAGLRWRNAPTPSFPSRAQASAGLAGVTCTVRADGTLRGCTAESEFPEGSGFGRAAELGAHRTGRVVAIDPSGPSLEGRTIAFVTRYMIDDSPWVQPPPSHIPGRDEAYNPPPKPPED